jgi:hypothetical protein
MSDAPLDPRPVPESWIRPVWFLTGLLLGLAALSYLGWRSGRTDYHPGFKRIYPAISPETNYYPTLNEMLAIVRAQCRHDQVLVIVGGNSILQGVWQPLPDLWSTHLQQLLGDRYCVINLAFRGGSPTDGGAVVAEVLRDEYPKQIYIADEAAFNGVESFAHEPYRYIFWQAYFRGWLLPSEARARHIGEYQSDRDQKRTFREAAISVWLDRALNYRDLWNRVCFEDFCTVPSYLGGCVPAMLIPRNRYPDEEPDAYNPAFMARKYSADGLDAEMSIVRATTRQFYAKSADGQWVLSRAKLAELKRNYAEAFPAPLRSRTLMLVGRNSPFYRRRLPADEQVRDEVGYRDAVSLWRNAGFPAIEYGRDFGDDDYGDRTHLSKTGGLKLAELVAPEVEAIARRRSYIR